MFDFHQTEGQYFYTNLNTCFGEMEVFKQILYNLVLHI
jgi:hypothetical protein